MAATGEAPEPPVEPVRGFVFLLAACLLGAASGTLAWAHVRRVIAVLRADVDALALALKRVPAAERLMTLQERSAPGSWERDLAVDVLAASSEDAKVAAVNLALAEIEHALARSERWPAAAVRIALLGGGFLALLAKVVDPAQMRWTIAIAAASGLAAATCAQAARTGARHAERQRRAVDALVAAALALPPAGRAPSPAAGRGAPRRRRSGGS